MSELVDRIEQAIKEKGSNFKRVERECGLGNGTIKRWGEQSPRLDKLVLVSEYLQISLDYLVFGRSCSETAQENDRNAAFEHLKQEQGLTCDGSPLEDEEADLIAMYRLLPEEHRRTFLTSFISNIESTSNGKKSLFTGRITTAAPQQKAAPPRTLKPKVEPLDFLRCFDLVVNLFSVELKNARAALAKRPKPLKTGQFYSFSQF